MLNFLVDPLNNLEAYNKLKIDIEKKNSPIATYGIIDESIGHIIYALKEHTKRQILLITYNEIRSRKIYEDIKNLGNNNVFLLPKRELVFYEVDAFSYESTNERLGIVSRLVEGEDILLVTSIEAILHKLMSKEVFKAYSQEIRIGEEINLDNLVKLLVDGGYERVNMVEGIGQFSMRGGIIDFFPPYSLNPIRIELFDEEIDSIRTFDITNQRSIEVLDYTFIFPVKENFILDEYRETIINNLDKDLTKSLSKSKISMIEKENLENKFNKYKEYLTEKLFISNMDMIVPYIPEKYLSSIISYLKEDAIIYIDEPKRIEESIKNLDEDFNLKFTDLYEVGEVLPSHSNILYNYDKLLGEIKEKACITNSALLSGDNSFNPKSIHNFSVKGMQSYHNKMDILKEDINHFKYRGYKIIILSGTEERGRRLYKILLDMGIETSFMMNKDAEIKSSQVFITPGSLQGGFEYPALKLIVISDKEIFGAGKKKSGKLRKKDPSKSISFADLNIGDYVVHENHGIGRYEGVEQLNIQGIKKDYLTIIYKGEDKNKFRIQKNQKM